MVGLDILYTHVKSIKCVVHGVNFSYVMHRSHDDFGGSFDIDKIIQNILFFR